MQNMANNNKPTISLNQYPKDFDTLCQLTELKNLFSVANDIPSAIEKIEKNDFFQWLNNKKTGYDFVTIKNKWINKKATKPNEFLPKTLEELTNKYFLELTCAGIIKYFIDNISTLAKFSSKHEGYVELSRSMNRIYKQFSPILVIDNIIQQLLLLSLDCLLTHGIQSPFFSGKQDSLFLARRTMLKTALYFLYLYLVPDFFLGHVSDLEQVKKASDFEYQNGIILYNNHLYAIDFSKQNYIHIIKNEAPNVDTLKAYCNAFPINSIYTCHEMESADECIQLFDLCSSASARSFMKFDLTDNFIIETSLAITQPFFTLESGSNNNAKEFAHDMKKLVFKQKKIKQIVENMTVAELLVTDFSKLI